MKENEIKVRISQNLKEDFQSICDDECTTMSNKIIGYITKEVGTKKPYKKSFKTNLIKFGVVNSNGHLYPKSELTRIRLDDDGIEYTELERLGDKIFYGQFGHPEDGYPTHKYNATHLVTNVKLNGDWLEGEVTILNDSLLPILNNVVFRPRSFGSVNENNTVNEFEIIGFDAILKTNDSFNIDEF